MTYCILIRISHKTISFSANRNGEGDFSPYPKDERVRALAVWFTGSSVTIGNVAKQQAQMGTSNAFYHIFDRMKERRATFEYSNETHSCNKLLLYTIRAGLEEFFVKEMMNSQGQLEDNIGHLPLLVAFDKDVSSNERDVVTRQLRGNGFGNVKVIDEDYYLRHAIGSEDNVLVLSSDGDTLYGSYYKQSKRVGDFSAEGLGRDPRLKKLASLIWDRSGAQNDWLEYSDEERRLEDAANRFINGAKSYCDDEIIMSNGNRYSYYLDSHDLQTLTRSNNMEVTRTVIDKIQLWNGDKQTCCIILTNQTAKNKYIIEQLNKEFPSRVFVAGKEMKDRCNELLLEDCRKVNFIFPQPSVPPAVITDPATTSTMSHPEHANTPPATSGVEPSKRDLRDFRMLEKEVEAYKANGDKRTAKEKCNAFLKAMHIKGVLYFDTAVNKILSGIENGNDRGKVGNPGSTRRPHLTGSRDGTSSVNNRDAGTKDPVEPKKRDVNLFNHLSQELQAYKQKHDSKTARSKAEAFLAEMHEKGITDFDKEIEQLLSQIKDAVEPSPLDKRNFRILKSTIETLRAKKDNAGIQRECKKFLEAMHVKNIVAFDDDVNSLLK